MARTTAPHVALVVVAVLFVAVVTGTGAASMLSQVASGTFERTSTLAPVTGRFTVDNDAGNVTLAPSADGAVHVRTVIDHGLGEPEVTEENTAAGVRLAARCTGFLATRCDVDYTVELPPSFAVTIDGTAGDVTASGLTGPVTVRRASGDVALFDLTGPLDVTTTSGGIDGAALHSAAVRAETRSGDVRLELLTPPSTVIAETVHGEIDLAVPATDAGYRVSARSDHGDERVLVPVDPTSQQTITANVEQGDIRIHPAP